MTAALLEALEATWPPAEARRFAGLAVGRGAGGGGRLSSVRAVADWQGADLDAALAQQDAWGEGRLIRVHDADARLAQAAQARGLAPREPVVILSAPLSLLAGVPAPRLSGFALWPPLAIQRELWAEAGIGPARQAAMARAPGPRAALLGRDEARVAGTGFCAVSGPVAGLHALWVRPGFRGRGCGEWMLRQAARWALAEGAEVMMLAVQRGNGPALRLYQRVGFQEADGYVYYAAP